MSEAIKILEGGVDRSQNQIFKLKTDTVGGGVCYWIPETELATDDKSITANGTYTAEQDGLYGYSELHVSVPASGGVSGKDNPGGGTDWNNYEVDVDDDGYIVETEIPAAISVTIPPTKLEYYDGDTIDYTGMVVTLLRGNGEVFTDSKYPDGIIPSNEIILTEHVAHTEGSGRTNYFVCDTSNTSIDFEETEEYIYSYRVSYRSEVRAVIVNDSYFFVAHDTLEGTQAHVGRTRKDEHRGVSATGTFHLIADEYACAIVTGLTDEVTVIPRYETSADPVQTALYYTWGAGATTTQSIPVQWASPYNAETLGDSFEISVSSVESGTAHGNEGGSSDGGFEGGGSEHGF